MKNVAMNGLALVLLLAACGGASDDIAEPVRDAEAPESASPTEDAGSDPGATTSLVGSEAAGPVESETIVGAGETVIDDGAVAPSNEQAASAVADLAGRLGVDASSIVVFSVEEVTWRDGSLGCPEPGMSYTQALVQGTLTILEMDGRRYHYHSSTRREPFLCTNPTEPLDTELPPADPDL